MAATFVSDGAPSDSRPSPPGDADPSDAASRVGDSLKTFCFWLLGAVALGFVVRFAYAYGFKWNQPLAVSPGGSRDFIPLGGDATYYHFQAKALAEGLWFVDPWSWAIRGTGIHPSAEHPPLYTLFLSLPSVLGFGTFRQHMLASAVLGSLTCGVVGFAGRAVAGRRVGIVAAFIAAIYANLWINDALVLSETIAAFMAALVVWFAYRFWRDPSLRWALLFGFACGLAALTRAELIILFPIVALPLVLRARGLDNRARLQRGLAMVLMAALPVLPWVVFNMTRFNNPVLLSTGGDITLSNTYCDSTFYGDRFAGWDIRCALAVGDRWEIPGDESDQMARYREAGLDYLGEHLDRLPVVAAARAGRMWELYKPFEGLRWNAFEHGRGPLNVARLALAQFYVLAILAIVGLVMLRRRRIVIYPLVGLMVACTIAAMLTFGNARYRVPAEIAIVIAAAVPIVALFERWSGRRRATPDDEAPDAARSDNEVPAATEVVDAQAP